MLKNGIAIFLFTTASLAFAKPMPKREGPVDLPDSLATDYDFEGIAALSNCSGSLFQLDKAKTSDKALVLTNAHCLEGHEPQPGEFVFKKPSTRKFNLLNKIAAKAGTVAATQILYSTETDTDLAIYELSESYDEIRSKYGVTPLSLSPERTSEQTAIEVISGYWKRGYSCTVETFVDALKEDIWTWSDSIRYSRPGCETIGGTSGSPVVVKGTRKIVGVNNTGNENGAKCTLNNPCEVDAKGNVTFQKGYSYAQQTFWVYTCLNEANEFDLKTPGCRLLH